MKAWLRTALLGLGLGSFPAWGEPDSFGLGSGRDGPLTVSEPGRVLNRYAQVNGPAAPGDTVLLVADTDGFSKGDLVMVLQSTGLVPEPSPGGSKPIELSHDAVGQWEFARLSASGEGVLTLTAPLVNAYAAQVTQVIRVPEYTQLRIREGAEVRAAPWNGRTGGVVALLATGAVLNEGTLSATGAGFRGGVYVPDAFEPALCLGMSVAARPGARKGEGIAVTQYGPTTTGREAVSHGGGGGLCPLAGGGGGGNGGPGGRGGGSTGLTGENLGLGGEGGAKLLYSLANRLSFGGGGGGGQGEDEMRPEGGAGGGALLIRAHQLSGSGVIVADGAPGGMAGRGGAGGGGAGGSIHVRLDASADCGGVFARGGAGGGASRYLMEIGIPGGGGGGGRILFQTASHGACPLGVEAGTGGVTLAPTTANASWTGAQPNRDTLSSHSGLIEQAADVSDSASGDDVSQFVAVPRVTAPLNDAYVNPGPGLVIKGTAEADSVITVSMDGVAVASTAKANAQGAWTMTVAAPPGEPAFIDHEVYSVKAKASKNGENSADSAVNRFTVDSVTPKTTITNRASLPIKTNVGVITFDFDHDDECPSGQPGSLCSDGFYNDVQLECSRDGTLYESCAGLGEHLGSKQYNISTDGKYTFFVRARDRVNVGPPDKYEWEFDQTRPVVTISKKPASRTSLSDAAFEFQAGESGVSFECTHAGVSSNCTSPHSYNGLSEGLHEFQVKAKDGAENVSAVVSWSWFIDKTAPVAEVTSQPSSPTNSTSATFKFRSNEAGSTFQCALDDESKYESCDVSKTYPDITDGNHVFYVRAIDDVGNQGVSAKAPWTVDLQLPVTKLKTSPDVLTTSKSARFEFFTTKTVLRFECALSSQDNGAFSNCGSIGSSIGEKYYPSLGDGQHTFRVRAVDLVGNRDEVPVEYSWIIDTTPPVVVITEPKPEGKSTTPFVLVAGTTEAGSDVFIYFDNRLPEQAKADSFNGEWQLKLTSALSEGAHTLRVEAVDRVKLKTSSGIINFTVNTFRPETKIDSGPPDLDKSSTATFVFSAPNARPGDVVQFKCQLDGGARSSCESVQGFSRLTNDSHELQVSAVVDGNEDLSPAVYKWTVRIEPPPPPEILEPVNGGRVDTGSPTISGRSVPKGKVYVFIDGVGGGIAPAGPDGSWTFKPPLVLEPGEHTVDAESEDEIGNKSGKRSSSVSFLIEKPSGFIGYSEDGGGLSCSAGGAVPGSMLLWGLLALFGVGRRRC